MEGADVARIKEPTEPPKRDAAIGAAELTVPERVLLFCVASGTDWARAGVTGATATAMVVKGPIERDASDQLTLTKEGRAALDALLSRRA
jgi:hypothetical protein